MKLKFICAPASGNGGTETVLVKALNHLAKTNDVELYLTTVPENRIWLKQMDQRIIIHEIKHENKFNKLIYLSRIFLMARSDDHFIVLSVNAIKLAAKIRKMTGKSYSITSWIHYSLINQNMFNPQNITFADNHWAISTPIKQQLMGLGIAENKISLIFNPVDEYQGKLNETDDSDVLHLVYVGKIMLDGQKNLRELFQGVKAYRGKIHLDLFGADASAGRVKDFVRDTGIKDECTFHGWVQNPWRIILSEVHPNALVLTSHYEGLPMVMIEAMSRGIPCLVADFSGYEDIIDTPQNGLVYKSGSVTDLTKTLKALSQMSYDVEQVKKSVDKFNSNEYYRHLDSIVNGEKNEQKN